MNPRNCPGEQRINWDEGDPGRERGAGMPWRKPGGRGGDLEFVIQRNKFEWMNETVYLASCQSFIHSFFPFVLRNAHVCVCLHLASREIVISCFA